MRQMRSESKQHQLAERVLSRPFAFGAALTAAKWLLIGLLGLGLPIFSPDSFPDLRSTLINGVGIAFSLVIVAALGWWREAGLAAGAYKVGGNNGGWWLLVPLMASALSLAVGGITGSAVTLASSAVLFLALGLNEELLSRGLVLRSARRLGVWQSVVWSALLFGGAHLGNSIFFGVALSKTVPQVISAAAFGLAYGAVRVRIGTLWPLVFLHALGDFLNTNSANGIAWWWYLCLAVLQTGYGIWVLLSTQSGENAVTIGSNQEAG